MMYSLLQVMAQRPKDEVRKAILTAAVSEFAAVGFASATLANIASQGGTSIGNLYKYFASKDELFQAAMPPQVADKLQRLLRRRVRALDGEANVMALAPEHPYQRSAEDLLRFTLAHRSQVLFLLTRAQGTSFADFANRLVRSLTRLAVRYAQKTYPRAEITAPRRRALRRIYRSFLGSLSAIISDEKSSGSLRRATGHLTTYHLAGLRAFFVAAQPNEKEARL